MVLNNRFLYFSVLTVNLYCITIGLTLSWNSPVIPKLLSNDTNSNPLGKPITLIQVSTLTTLFPVGSLIGTLLIGKITDVMGRKTTLIYLAILTTTSYCALFFSSHIIVLYVFLTTVAVGIAAAGVVIPIYTTEIAEDRNRGQLGCLMGVVVSFGQFLAYLLGPILNVGVFALICGSPVFLFLILSVLIPETPVFLSLTKGDTEAINVLGKLRRHQSLGQIESEYAETQQILQYKTAKVETNFVSIFNTKSGRRAFLISIGIKTFQQLSGMYIIISFLAPLFNETGSSISGETLAVVVGVGKIVAAAVALNLIEKVGRRCLILSSCFTCGFSLFIVGLYFYFLNNDYIIPNYVKCVPIVSILAFVIMFTFGLSAVPNLVISELLPNEYRSIGSSVATIISNICLIAASFTFPIAAEYFGVHYCLFTFSLFNFIGFIFIFLTLPETKGKSFAEIRTLLND